jgi:uncharacterized protein (TIRG00374 family)
MRWQSLIIYLMALEQPPKFKFRMRPTIIAVAAILLIGGLIIFLDRAQISQLSSTADWRLIIIALLFTAVSYFLHSASLVYMFRIFGIKLEWPYLMRVSWLSIVQHNLIALPAALSFRLLLLNACGVDNHRILGGSLLLVYIRDLLLFSLIPFSMAFVAATGHFSAGGVTAIVILAAVIGIGVIAVSVVYLNRRLRVPVLATVCHLWRRFFHRDVTASVQRFADALDQGIAILRGRRKSALVLMALVLGDIAATITTIWFCFAALGITVDVGVLVAGFNLGVTLAVIPFVPTQLGIQDVSMAGIFAIFGVPFSFSILGAILFRVIFYFVPFIVSLPEYWHTLRETARRARCLIPAAKNRAAGEKSA